MGQKVKVLCHKFGSKHKMPVGRACKLTWACNDTQGNASLDAIIYLVGRLTADLLGITQVFHLLQVILIYSIQEMTDMTMVSLQNDLKMC